MKKIKLQVVNNQNFNKVLVKVTEQTSRYYNFGGNVAGDSRKFQAKNGLILASNERPARDADDSSIVWVRGYDASKDDSSIVLTRAQFDKLGAAVREYNEFWSASAVYDRQLIAQRAQAAARLAAQQLEAARQAEALRRAAAAAPRYAASANSCSYIIG